jgi:hypothetical protein
VNFFSSSFASCPSINLSKAYFNQLRPRLAFLTSSCKRALGSPKLLMKIVSGGQTGVDRAALDFALEHQIEHGGWCPVGRIAEDGVIPERYGLMETPTAEPAERTKRNVLDADATLIIASNRLLQGGTLRTKEIAQAAGKPVLIVSEADGLDKGTSLVAAFLRENVVRILNVAGPRESEAPALGNFARKILTATILHTECI